MIRRTVSIARLPARPTRVHSALKSLCDEVLGLLGRPRAERRTRLRPADGPLAFHDWRVVGQRVQPDGGQ